MGKDSMWFFQKISLGLALVNGILVSMADNELTMDEIVNIINTALAGFAADLKLTPGDLQVFYKDDGSVAIMLSAELVKKFNISL